jgi:hypothetical protein
VSENNCAADTISSVKEKLRSGKKNPKTLIEILEERRSSIKMFSSRDKEHARTSNLSCFNLTEPNHENISSPSFQSRNLNKTEFSKVIESDKKYVTSKTMIDENSNIKF